jgi:hypothetical protein
MICAPILVAHAAHVGDDDGGIERLFGIDLARERLDLEEREIGSEMYRLKVRVRRRLVNSGPNQQSVSTIPSNRV